MSAHNANPPRNDTKVSFVEGNLICKNKCGNSKPTIYQTVEESSSSGEHNDDRSDYGILDPSGSDHDQEALDILNMMSAYNPNFPRNDETVSFAKDNSRKCRNPDCNGTLNRTLHQTVEECSDEDDDPSDYGHVLKFTSAHGSRDPQDDNSANHEFHLMST